MREATMEKHLQLNKDQNVPNVSRYYQIGAVLNCNGTRVSDPDPHRSGSRRAKNPQKYVKKSKDI
jgi:hypothetical protein